jgi:hypothetical protein
MCSNYHEAEYTNKIMDKIRDGIEQPGKAEVINR